MLKLRNVIVAIIFCSVCMYGQEAGPPKELLQYVRDAQKAGLKPSEIERNAVNAGWPATAVDDALAYVTSNKKDSPAADAGKKTAAAPVSTAQAEAPADKSAASAASGAGDAAGTPKPAAAAPAAAPDNSDTNKVTAAPPAAAATPEAAPAADKTGVSAPPPAAEAKSDAAETKTAPAGTKTAAPGAATPPTANISDEYQIGAGDVLKITVWKEPDASLQSGIVLPSGRISIPLLHEIDVAGMTVPQLEKLLTDRFANLINAPEVSVTVLAMNSKKIYITGKVKKEGPLPYAYEMTVMQALSEAGGLTDYAKKKNIYVLRTENGKQFKLPFDYAAVLKGLHLETNYTLIPGDMIVVP